MQGTLAVSSDSNLFYTIDDFTDPWRHAEVVVMVHGLAESGEAWRAWVPHLARHYRVVRLDQRGFGRSTPMALDFPWTLDVLAGDLARLIEDVAHGPVHVVGAKIGATVSARLAATYPALVKTLTLIGMPVVGPKRRIGCDPEQHGVLEWARSTQKDRLGKDSPPEMLEYWSQLMKGTPLSTLVGFGRAVGSFDVRGDLPHIASPVLLLTSDSALHPLSESDSWRSTLRDVQLVAIPGDGFHAAAVNPDLCARTVIDFIKRKSVSAAHDS